MSSGGGTTTVTQAASEATGHAIRGLSLVWRFPRAGAPPIPLQWEGGGELVLGRDAGCSIQLAGHDVSRRHAVLRNAEQGGHTTIADLGGRNGVRVDGRRVAEAHLAAQNVVRLGGWVGVVTAASGEVEEIAPGFWGGGGLRAALAPLRQVATSDLPIVLQGETGSGKERVADALHRWSARGGPFVAVNCAALPEALAEAELFGYRRGAFTGADRASLGFFRSAEGGTLLLDEVSDLPLAVQAKLLRVLEEREVQPLGELRPVAIDVRIVVASQQSLMHAVRTGRFRANLLARLDGLTVLLPPLRERREDVLPLFSRLSSVSAGGRIPAFESDLAERLCAYDWPFNVRELVLLARRLITIHGTETTLRAHHLPPRMWESGFGADMAAADSAPAGARPGAPAADRAAPAASEPVQLSALIVALRVAGGNVARAAATLGISRQRAYRLMEGQGVDLDELRGDREEPP